MTILGGTFDPRPRFYDGAVNVRDNIKAAAANPFSILFFFKIHSSKNELFSSNILPSSISSSNEDEAAGQSDLAQQDSPFMQS